MEYDRTGFTYSYVYGVPAILDWANMYEVGMIYTSYNYIWDHVSRPSPRIAHLHSFNVD